MRYVIRIAVSSLFMLALATACAPRASRPGRSTTVITTGGDRGRRTGVPADTRSRSGRGESPPGQDRDRRAGVPADTRSRSDRGSSPPGQDRDREERGRSGDDRGERGEAQGQGRGPR